MDGSDNLGIREAVAFIRRSIAMRPKVGLVLGSGLGDVAEAVTDARSIDTTEIPGYPRSTVPGHRGRLVFGNFEGCPVVFIQGRVHLYEGHPIGSVVFPIRLLHALGARRLLVTNAAGGINPYFEPGTLMFIVDHLNLAFRHPRIGAGELPVHVSEVTPYDEAWIAQAERIGARERILTRRGVYLWTQGPSYESKAEIRMFAGMGADAVGMSTVPEVLEARALGMRVLGISTITNAAAGLGQERLSHEEVLAVGRQVRGDLERLVRGIIREVDRAGE